MGSALWHKCLDRLQEELPSQQFNMWIRPLQVEPDGNDLRLLAPNRFVLDWVNDKFISRITELLDELSDADTHPCVMLVIGTKTAAAPQTSARRSRAVASPSVSTHASRTGHTVTQTVQPPSTGDGNSSSMQVSRTLALGQALNTNKSLHSSCKLDRLT